MQGLASTYLTACQPGDTVHFSIVSSPSFHLPMDPSCPAIFVAAGTGIAPFRSFWMERSARARYATNLAPAVLFFGCRSKAADCLFHEVRSVPFARHLADSCARRARAVSRWCARRAMRCLQVCVVN